MGNIPKLSFVVPTHNRVHWLAECIQSLRKQTEKEIEIIVIDDCSTDTTPQLMKWFVEQDDRIMYVRNETNIGAGMSRNKGNQLATGDIICVADDDDFYPETRAAETLKYFKTHKKTDMVNGSYYRVDYSNGITEQHKAEDFNKKDFEEGKGVYFCHPSAAYRRKDIIDMPYKPETKSVTDDHQLVKEWTNAGKKIKGVPNVWCYHRVLPGSMMTNLRGGSLE